MVLSDAFYEDEIREGFYVPAAVKQAWGAQLLVLAEIDRICRHHRISYYAEWGTLLGAVRHGGFIPWDDDLDIGMKRQDYERFLQAAKQELPEGYEIYNIHTKEDHTGFLANVVSKSRICFEKEHLEKFHGYPYITGIDIFVLDYVYRDEEKEKLRRAQAKLVLQTADAIYAGKLKGQQAAEALRSIENSCRITLTAGLEGINLRRELYALVEAIFKMVPENEADYMTRMMPNGLQEENHLLLPKEMVDNLVYIPFEETMIPVFAASDLMLRRRYGEYMKLYKNASGHNYPYFEAQKLNFQKILDFELPGFHRVDRSLLRTAPCTQVNGKVVFLPFSAAHWDTMQPLYTYYMAQPEVQVLVIPIPYYYKNYDFTLRDAQYDLQAYPEELPVLDYRSVDWQNLQADVMVTQFPYDEYNETFSIPPQFYVTNLRSMASQVLYIPWFAVEEFTKDKEREYHNMNAYCCMPGVVYADRVYLQSGNMRRLYVEKLTEFAGEDTRVLWEQKMHVLAEITGEGVSEREKAADRAGTGSNAAKEDAPGAAPEEASVTGRHKTPQAHLPKKLLYGIAVPSIWEYEEAYFRKMDRVLQSFQTFADRISVTAALSAYEVQHLAEKAPAVYQKLQLLLQEKAPDMEICLLDQPREDSRYLAAQFDAYYGGAGIVAHAMRNAHKPVMIENVEM